MRQPEALEEVVVADASEDPLDREQRTGAKEEVQSTSSDALFRLTATELGSGMANTCCMVFVVQSAPDSRPLQLRRRL